MKSPAQPTPDYSIISLSCARPWEWGARARGDGGPRDTVTPPPASGLEVTWRFSATRWARGRANLSRPPQRALGLTRGRHRGQSPPGTASGRERRSLHGPAAARGVPSPSSWMWSGRAGCWMSKQQRSPEKNGSKSGPETSGWSGKRERSRW